jgi:hypothetical protein
MKMPTIITFYLFVVCGALHAQTVPTPLVGVKVITNITVNASGFYNYQYSISNPATNSSSLYSIDIFLAQDPTSDVSLTTTGLNHCSAYFKTNSENILKTQTVTAVGSSSPQHWNCGYGKLASFSDNSYGWGARQQSSQISPGVTQSGFLLTSYGPPSIRDILVRPWIDVDLLPAEYSSNVQKTVALQTSVQWLGKTVGPKAPPKTFSASDFINYLISIKEQSVSLGWIKNQGVANSLGAKLNDVKKKITSGDNKTAKNVLGAFQNEVQAQNGKQLTSEAYALLYFNAKYLIDHLN